MTRTFNTGTTYTHTHTFFDEDDEVVNLNDADDIKYRMTTERGGGDEQHAFELADGVKIVDAEGGIAEIVVPPDDLEQVGTFWEEWRLTMPPADPEDPPETDVTYQETVRFIASSTDA